MATMATRRRTHPQQPPSNPSKAGSRNQPWPENPDTRRKVPLAQLVVPVLLIAMILGGRSLWNMYLWKIREDYFSPISIVDIPGKGKGVLARRDIQAGELLFKESPLFVVPPSIQESPTTLIRNRLSHLSTAERDAFYSLSYVLSSVHPDAPLSDDMIGLQIFQTNAISAGENVGIFPRVARLNHGCSSSFNAVYSWREKDGELVVHALKSISQGEEVLTTYTDTKRPRSERRKYLEENYGFTCNCSTCALPDGESKASDRRLVEMKALYDRFRVWGTGEIEGPEAVHVASQIWRLGEEEGYWSERGQLAADVVYIAAAHSDEEAVVLWVTRAIWWYGQELGKDSPQAARMRDILKNPKSHAAWGTRRYLNVQSHDETEH